MQASKVLGLTGKKYSGKNYVADLITSRYSSTYNIQHFAFAERLKRLIVRVFNLRQGQLQEPLKDKPFHNNRSIYIDNELEQIETFLDIELSQKDRLAHTPRELMQLIGTEYVRADCPNYWIDYLETRLKMFLHAPYITTDLRPRFAIVTDVRFDNEALMLGTLGGQTALVVGSESLEDLHSSEEGISRGLISYTLNNSDRTNGELLDCDLEFMTNTFL